MTQEEAIRGAIEARILSNADITAFDFAGNFRLKEIKRVADKRQIHWLL